MARRPGRFVRGPRSATDWSASVAATAFVPLAASTIVLDQVFTPIAGGETVLRTRGRFTYGSDQANVNEQQLGAVGIGVVSEQAATVGVTACPHPDTDAAWGGWLWHSYYGSQTRIATAVGWNELSGGFIIDSKAMRKVGENERLIIVVENSSPFGMIYSVSIRILSKVH